MKNVRGNRLLRGLRVGGLLLVLSPLFWGIFVEPHRLTVRRETVFIRNLPPELENCRAVLVGDTHFGNSFIDRWRRDRIIRFVRRENPHTVWLLGDYVAVGTPLGGGMETAALEEFFRALKAPLGTFAVLGNHELWYGRSEMRRILERAGIPMVENKVVKVGGKLSLAGVPEGETAEFDASGFNRLLSGHDPLVLLSHSGNMLKRITHSYSGVMAAADTHGGQIRIPGKGALKEFLKGKKELKPGLSVRWGKQLFVTTGAGGHRWGFRLFCPPEIAVITLKARRENT